MSFKKKVKTIVISILVILAKLEYIIKYNNIFKGEIIYE